MIDTLVSVQCRGKQSRHEVKATQRPCGAYCRTNRLFGFKGRVGIGACVIRVAWESSSLILEDSHHYALQSKSHLYTDVLEPIRQLNMECQANKSAQAS